MSLPANNMKWPPDPWDTALSAWALNDAWYLGDTTALASIYAGDQRDARRSELRRGGVLGALKSFFWGRPVPPNQARTRLHVPLASDVAVLASDLMFAEPPEVRVEDKSQQAILDEVVNSDDAHAGWNTMGEYKSVFGAAVITTTWDRAVQELPWLQVTAADVAIPTFTAGRLTAVSLWSEYRVGTSPIVWRHLERHERGAILHGLYQGTEQNLGTLVPLQDRPETEHLAALVNSDGAIPTGIDYLTASWNINMPSRVWRKQGALAHAGRSDFQGVHGLFDMVDEAWSSWMRDLRLARARLQVPEQWLDVAGPGEAAGFDQDQEIYSPLRIPGSAQDARAELFQPAIRFEEHEATLRALTQEVLRATGISAASWGDYGEAQMTATETTARESQSERTRDKKSLYDKRAIAEQARAALALAGSLGNGDLRPDLPEVTFPRTSQESPETLARTAQLLDAAGAASTETKVRLVHPDWDDPRVKQEVGGIRRESSEASPFTSWSPDA